MTVYSVRGLRQCAAVFNDWQCDSKTGSSGVRSGAQHDPVLLTAERSGIRNRVKWGCSSKQPFQVQSVVLVYLLTRFVLFHFCVTVSYRSSLF